MGLGDEFFAMALDLLRKAEVEADPKKRVGLEALAETYRGLGEQTKKSELRFKSPSYDQRG